MKPPGERGDAPLPADDGGGRHDAHCVAPAEKERCECERKAPRVRHPWLDASLEIRSELLFEREDVGVFPALRAKAEKGEPQRVARETAE